MDIAKFQEIKPGYQKAIVATGIIFVVAIVGYTLFIVFRDPSLPEQKQSINNASNVDTSDAGNQNSDSLPIITPVFPDDDINPNTAGVQSQSTVPSANVNSGSNTASSSSAPATSPSTSSSTKSKNNSSSKSSSEQTSAPAMSLPSAASTAVAPPAAPVAPPVLPPPPPSDKD